MADERWDTGIDYDERRSGASPRRDALRRIFGDGENILTWGIPLYSLAGIRVKIHVTLAVFIVGRLIWSAVQDEIGFSFMLPMLTALGVLVLLHEYGHCVVCRLRGGEADEIMLWPLGGLAMCRPPERWKAHLLVTLGGPAVNVIFFPALALATYVAAGTEHVILINPLTPGLYLPDVTDSVVATWLWSFYYVNLVLILFNAIPMFPMDGGRVLHALLWRSMGRHKATSVVATTGIVVAVVMAIVAVRTESLTVLLVAMFGVWTCLTERKRERLLATGWDGDPFVPSGLGEPEGPDDPEPDRGAEDQAEVDRVLAKISAQGMDALTRAERRTLKRATRRGREA